MNNYQIVRDNFFGKNKKSFQMEGNQSPQQTKRPVSWWILLLANIAQVIYQAFTVN